MKEPKVISRLSNFASYKPIPVLLRIILMSALSVILIILAKAIGIEDLGAQAPPFKVYLLTMLAFNTVSEASLGIIKLFRKSKKLRNRIYLQMLALVAVSVVLVSFWLIVIRNSFEGAHFFEYKVVQITIVIALLILIIHWLIAAVSVLTQEQLASRDEIDELKRAKIISDYNSLKDRLNPHFLFNNLSVLKSLIHYDPDSAEKFTENFTDVYRYVLDSHSKKTINLNDEIKFLNSYIALHKERLGEGLNISFDIKENDLQYSIPPLSLQLLVENAIKHNIANKSNPLSIEIFTENQNIIVKNNLNKKETTYSTLSGLSSLEGQYQLLANKNIKVIEKENEFIVTLPLI